MAEPEYLENLLVVRRRALHTILTELLGSTNVYFQPPSNVLMKYPCFLYNQSPLYNLRADDKNYLYMGHYSLTYIDSNVERAMAMKMKILDSFEHISFERNFTSENLNHDVYNLYY